MSTIPVSPRTDAEISDREKQILEQRLDTADGEERQDARYAIEEIRRKIQHSSTR